MISQHRLTLLCGGLVLGAAIHAEASDRFALGRFIPADSWMLIGATPNPENAWLEARKAEIFAEAKASGVDRDIVNLVLGLMPAQDLAEAQATLDKAGALISAVRWSDLVGGEIAFAERMTNALPGYEYIFLARGAGDSNKENAKALAAMLEEIASMTDKLSLAESKTESGRAWTLRLDAPDTDLLEIPHFTLFLKNNILGMTMGTSAAEDVIALMDGKAGSASIVELPRFKSAVAEMREPEDYLMFFDIKMLLSGIHGMFTRHIRIEGQDGEEKTKQVSRIFENAFELCNVIDYSVSTMETDGLRQLTHTMTRIREDKMESPLARAFLNRKAFESFDKYVPASATGFSMNTTIDMETVYNVFISFVEKNIPDGPAHIAKWNGLLDQVGLDPQRDIFDWLSGEAITISMPAAMVSPMSSGDSVLMIRVKDSELAAAKVSAAVGFVQKFLEGTGQPIMVTDAPNAGEGFVELTHPLFMLFVKPVVGVHDEWLMIGSSTSAVNKCLQVAAGKAPSILENKRFMREGLVPTGPVLSASFADTSKFGQEVGAAMGLVSMLGGGVIANIPESDPEAAKVKKALKGAMGIVLKLAPILQKIDYYSSESSLSMRRGGVVRHEKVVTYKKPKQNTEAATAEAAP